MKHILIVEDDTTFAVMLQTWLSKKKFSVASVSGIAAAKKTLIESSSIWCFATYVCLMETASICWNG